MEELHSKVNWVHTFIHIFFILSSGELYPDLASVLIPICQRFAESGSPKQAKHAVRCLHTNCTSDSDDVFERILEVSCTP